MNQEQWPKIEQKVNKAEVASRKKQLAQQEIFEETGLTKKERKEMGKKLGFENEEIMEIVEELESEKEILCFLIGLSSFKDIERLQNE